MSRGREGGPCIYPSPLQPGVHPNSRYYPLPRHMVFLSRLLRNHLVKSPEPEPERPSLGSLSSGSPAAYILLPSFPLPIPSSPTRARLLPHDLRACFSPRSRVHTLSNPPHTTHSTPRESARPCKSLPRLSVIYETLSPARPSRRLPVVLHTHTTTHARTHARARTHTCHTTTTTTTLD